LKATPIEWQRSFTLAGNRIQNTNLLTLEEYMAETESIMDDHRSGGKDRKNKNKDGNDTSGSNADSDKKKA
ncbi:MAG: hypothetical protein ACREOZ_02975, partial [Gloeomargaritales cyanobacterium]